MASQTFKCSNSMKTKLNKTARIREALIVPTGFKVYGAGFFLLKSSPHTPYTIKYKTKIFAPCNKSIMANKLLSTNLEQFLRRIKSPLPRL